MSKPSLGGNLPASNDANSLNEHADLFIDAPKATHLAVVEFGVNYLKQKPSNGDVQPVLQITHVELLQGKDSEDGEKILNRVFAKRTGQKSRVKPEDTPLDIPADDLDDSVDEV